MKSSLLAAATSVAMLGLSPLAVQAQSSVSIYGLVDMSAGRFQESGAPKVSRVDSGNMTTSYLGFKGVEDLGGSIKAKFALESFLLADTGAAGRFGGDAFWARNAYVGLEGDFGSTTLGRHTTALFVSTLLFNAFGDSFGFSPSIRQLFTPRIGAPFYGDTGWNNSISYFSGDMGGLSITLQGALGEGAATSVGNSAGGNLIYRKGPLAATLAMQQVKHGLAVIPAGFTRQVSAQGGVSYDAKVVKLFGQYTQVKTHAAADATTRIAQLGAAVPVGPGKVLVQYGVAKAKPVDLTQKSLALGYDYTLSPRTDAYAVLVNDKRTGLSTGNTYAMGMRMKF